MSRVMGLWLQAVRPSPVKSGPARSIAHPCGLPRRCPAPPCPRRLDPCGPSASRELVRCTVAPAVLQIILRPTGVAAGHLRPEYQVLCPTRSIGGTIDIGEGYPVSESNDEEALMASGNSTSKRGFASMDLERQREIASKGGRSVPAEKRSFSQDRELASTAGRKGGQSTGTGRPGED